MPRELPPRCDVLLFVATSTEADQLEAAAKEWEVPFQKKGSTLGNYRDLGKVGARRVLVVRTDMGAIGRGASAARALRYKEATGATGMISLGMAFGIDRKTQKYGDVLVASSVLPYDDRQVHTVDGNLTYSYDDKWRPFHANPSLLEVFENHVRANKESFSVSFGALLSGGARIRSEPYKKMLIERTAHCGEQVIGGEMEGAGLLAASDPDEPSWVIVKGISDFADDVHDESFVYHRSLACKNAATFVLKALCDSRKIDHS